MMMEQLTNQKNLQEKDTITEQINLLEIDLSRTSLSQLPDFQNNFQFCTTLNLSRNNLRGSIPWLANLKRLKWMDLSHNSLTGLSDVCGSISTLLYLNISHNNLTQLPDWILYLDKVTELNLSYNSIPIAFQLHFKVAVWAKIQVCNLENTNLAIVPECLRSAPKLRELYVGNGASTSVVSMTMMSSTSNKLWRFSEPLPPSLCLLEVSNLMLANLETNWKSLIHLKELRASANDISWFPYDLTSLSKLEVCDLNHNRLTILPHDFGKLENLCYINLAYNKVEVLPQSFERLKNLKHLDLYSNRLESIECDFVSMSR